MELKELLQKLSRMNGVAGREDSVGEYLSQTMAPYCSACTTTPLGSVICTVREPAPGQPHLMLMAHMDEIGFVVTYIDDNGFLKIANCGGVDRKLLTASTVAVHTRQGELEGVICSIPPHLQSGEGKTLPKVEDFYVDIGYPAQQARELVALGDTVTIKGPSQELMGDTVSGKALDDRACCAALVRAAQLVDSRELHCGVTVVFSTMEELGSQGGRTAAYAVNPTHAIALDVSFALTPDAKPAQCGELKKGPMIGISPILNREMTDLFFRLAEQNGIPVQTEVMGSKTGTDADVIATTRCGIRTGLLSIPQRYMHTPVELVAVQDVEDTARLLAAYLCTLGR